MQANGSIGPNPYAWNLNASVLYLETPVNTGFSFQEGTSRIIVNTDKGTLAQNVAALRSFFTKFPHLLGGKNPFYITGESYAGRYIPQLSVELLKQNFPPNFKGVAIGNGYFNPGEDKLNLFGYYHGISDSVNSSEDVSHLLYRLGINPYNILQDESDEGRYQPKERKRLDLKKRGVPILSSAASATQDSGREGLAAYLNRADLQAAIHIKTLSVPGQEWIECSLFPYLMERDSMATQVKTMVDSGRLKVIIYNGDLDSVCNFVGDQE